MILNCLCEKVLAKLSHFGPFFGNHVSHAVSLDACNGLAIASCYALQVEQYNRCVIKVNHPSEPTENVQLTPKMLKHLTKMMNTKHTADNPLAKLQN